MLDSLVVGLFIFIAACLVFDITIAMGNRSKIIEQSGILLGRSRKVPRTIRKIQTLVDENREKLNIDDLVSRIVSGVLEKLASGGITPTYNVKVEQNPIDQNMLNVEISMDESIVDVGVSTKGIESSTKELGKEETTQDKSLSKSKARIADILKKKGK